MLLRLQKRWQDWEQPLLLLSWMLHPNYRLNNLNQTLKNLNHVYLSKWLVYYYEAWSKKKPNSILREFEKYRVGIEFPFNNQSLQQFTDDILGFWIWVGPEAKELSFVAQ